jgi:NitT/TauT family transport system ATP-binding protein
VSRAEPLLVVEGVRKTFGKSTVPNDTPVVLEPTSFTVAAGELVCLLGPSGSGKSTLLRMIGGLLTPDPPASNAPGVIRLNGRAVNGPQPEIGFVFQRTNLMPWRTALQNVLLPQDVRPVHPAPAALARARGLMSLMGLSGAEDAYPRQLSGGMAQRVALARALFQDPELLLLDEPFGALDALTRERLNLELARIHEEQAKTLLMVTHSIQEAVLLADRVLILTGYPGRLSGEVSIDLPRPRRLEMTGEPHFGKLALAVRRAVEAN